MAGDYYKRDEVISQQNINQVQFTDTQLQPFFNEFLMRKDAKYTMVLAKVNGARMKNAEVADAHLAQVALYTKSKDDLPGIYGAVQQDAGSNFEE
jgi:3-hydroxyisobutyrate dehydrogenase-like beta-hydroxyacid dehydrogenase